ncbi:MAG: hypothetical protein UT11_C0063G0003 [Berkelbacteria bacterium GW2011_GWA2_38_9]|uniref:NYN domain-containing protein n=1 Tax=Berkelbacteria bacterium GW2011_GWA2_38_9 TaxID=1618334 RepID=A0A0G0L449_9BACT|nr:MAG: hypothetical protein UT11_C0063G0003 [Berkelbacteria bacterium GW2011_GWA2_38_9]
MNSKALILIDGSNFYFKLKAQNFGNLLKFSFRDFAEMLAEKDKIIDARYYIGRVRQDGTKRVDKMVADQQRLFARLKKNNFRYVLGYLLKTDGVYHEKGVDVQIAIDIIEAAYENICDRIILISSDTDLIPAITKAIKKGKTVEYIGFSHQPSKAMMNCCSKYRLLTKNDIGRFIQSP